MSVIRISVVEDEATREAAVGSLVARVDPLRVGPVSIAELCRSAVIFEVQSDGERIGFYALESRRESSRLVGWVLAAAGRCIGSAAMTRRVLPLIEKQFIGVDEVAIATKRPGLRAELSKQGYAMMRNLGDAGWVMRKALR